MHPQVLLNPKDIPGSNKPIGFITQRRRGKDYKVQIGNPQPSRKQTRPIDHQNYNCASDQTGSWVRRPRTPECIKLVCRRDARPVSYQTASKMLRVAGFLVVFFAVAGLTHAGVTLEAKKLKLSSGREIPAVGLGTSAIKPEELEGAIASALENGYRHIDTAFSYHNEASIGKALKKWFDQGGKREELFITSKLPSQANRPASVEKYLKRSLQDLGLDYVDMYLIHTPFAIQEGDNFSPKEVDGKEVLEDPIDHLALWKEMEKQVKAGRAKSIGVSNFNQAQLSNVYDNAEIKPSNLQVESHAYLQQRKLREFCKAKGIVMSAYAPLGSFKSRKAIHGGTEKDIPALVDHPVIKELAAKYKKSPAQILLRHTVQDGLVVVPKSSNSLRQKENIDIFDFELKEEDVKRIDQLDIGEKGRVFDFTIFYEGLDKHPQRPF